MSDAELRALERAARAGLAPWPRYWELLARSGGPACDLHGDPLPPRAVSRLGTRRLATAAPVLAADFAPDGALWTLSRDELARFDPATGRASARLAAEGVGPVAISPDGSRLALGALWQLQAEVLALEDGRRLASFGPGGQGRAGALAWSPDGERLAVGLGAQVRIFACGSGAEVALLRGSRGAVTSIAFSPDGSRVLVGGDRTPRLHDAASGKALARLPAMAEKVARVAWAPDGEVFASADEAGSVVVRDARSREPRVEVGGPIGEQTTELRFVAGVLAVGTGRAHGGMLRLLDPDTGAPRRTLADAHPGWTVAPDGRTAAAWGANGIEAARLHDLATGEPREAPPGHGGPVTSLQVGRDGGAICAGSWSAGACLWSPGGELGRRVEGVLVSGFTDRPRATALSPDGRRVACLGAQLHVLDVATGAVLHRVEHPHAGLPAALAWTPDGQALATGSEGLRTAGADLVLWSHRLEERWRVPLGRDGVDELAFSPDGRWLLAAPAGRGRVFAVASGAPDPDGAAAAHGGARAAWHPRDALCATADREGRVSYRASSALVVARPFPGARRQLEWRIQRLAWSPDGAALAVALDDGTVRVLDGVTLAERHVLAGHERPGVRCLAWFPDSRWLASGSDDGTVLIWDAR